METERPTIPQLIAAAERPLFSFEFFPPRDDAAAEQLRATIALLEPLDPAFVSITYGANGSTRDRTTRLTEELGRSETFRTVGHLTLVDQSVAQLREVLADYWRNGVRHVLALRGDPPGGPRARFTPHPEGLTRAVELVRLARQAGFCVAVAAFPDAADPDLAARVLVDKAAAGAEFAITQLFFDAGRYADLLARVRGLGCDLPIIPGVMPVTNIAQLERFAGLSGQQLPADVVRRLRAVADDPRAVREIGVDIAHDLCASVLALGAPGVHFFTQNRSRASRAVLARLRADRPG